MYRQTARKIFQAMTYIGAGLIFTGLVLWGREKIQDLNRKRFSSLLDSDSLSTLSTNDLSYVAATEGSDEESEYFALQTQSASWTPYSTSSEMQAIQTTQVPTLGPTDTRTPSPSLAPTATTEAFVINQNPSDGAETVFVPAGFFLMGSNAEEDPYFWGAEGPLHKVNVDEFWIYKTEVTNSMYQACVAEGQCPRPAQVYGPNAEDYYRNPAYADYPVIYVSYTHALSYCQWAGGRLPTEAEWEKAARGTDGRLFPWGDNPPTSQDANVCDRLCARSSARETQIDDGYSSIAPVGSFPSGVSPYGALDMAGNVWEWTFDWFNAGFYSISPEDNPRGPASGTKRVIRGGCWSNSVDGLRTVARMSLQTNDSLDTLGFRCVIEISDS